MRLEFEYTELVNTLARERDAFGKKETELAMKLRKAREALEQIAEGCEQYWCSCSCHIAKKALEEIK